MRFELKNIKFSEFASEETYCFEGTLWIDGKPWAKATNSGKGGGNDYYPVAEGRGFTPSLASVEAYLGKTKVDCGDGTVLDGSLDLTVGDLLEKWLVTRDVKKLLKKVAYLKSDGKVYTLDSKHKPTPETLKKVKEASFWRPDNVLLNELPLEKVIEIITGMRG